MKQISIEEAGKLVAQGEKLTPDKRSALADGRLRALVDYVRENSPFFRERYAALPANYSLSDLPPITKEELQTHFDRWATDRAVTQNALMQHIRQEEASGVHAPFLGKYTIISTSGSTGTPFVMLRDEYHNQIHGALVARRLMGRCGNTFSPVNNRIAAVIVTKPGVSSYASFLRTKREAGQYGENMLAVGISRPVAEIVECLNSFAPTTLTGYPSVLAALAREQDEGRLHLTLKCIVSSAEPLLEKAFNYISSTFKCPVLNNYCMTEGGEIAMSDGGCPQLHLNDDWILVEPVNNDGERTHRGAYSDGALITDLSNYICPIIRYRVDDRILLEPEPCSCGSALPAIHIAGRVFDCFTLCGTMFFPYGLIEQLTMLNGIVDFQLARVAKDSMEVRLCVDSKDSFEKVTHEAESIAREQLTLCGIDGAKIQVTNRLGGNSEKTGKRLAVVDEVRDDV